MIQPESSRMYEITPEVNIFINTTVKTTFSIKQNNDERNE